jgi:hypothetical protein
MRLAGRSPHELAFRLGQVLRNLKIWALPPSFSKPISAMGLNLPPLDKIRNHLADSTFRDELISLGDGILLHQIPLFEVAIDCGSKIEWRRDYLHGKTSGIDYFRFIPYLDFDEVGDHKNIWELNRHQHLVVLAQAQLLTGNRKYLSEICTQLESWWEQNPFLKGINWASALEVAFRSLSWIWIDHLTGPSLDPVLRLRLWNSLYQHGVYLECNLSTYFSPNTHLLGEGVALHAIGLRLNSKRWIDKGSAIVAAELERQVADDGSHFEQSTYYHLYALDLFLFHYLLAGRPARHRPTLCKMAHFLAAIIGQARLLTCFGDDDGGRLFHPYGRRETFARATLATCSVLFPEEFLPFAEEDLASQAEWWLGSRDVSAVDSRGITERFENSGLATISAGNHQIIVDTGGFGFGGAGHSHADTLSITARNGERELLIDPGTFTYVSDHRMRDLFRGTGFHNTIRVNGSDQAEPAGPFRWENKPSVRCVEWIVEHDKTYLSAICSYRGFRHTRRVLCLVKEWLLVLDKVEGPGGEHLVEQFWHIADDGVKVFLSDPKAATTTMGLRSRVFGQKESAPVICSSWMTTLPHHCAAALRLSETSCTGKIVLHDQTLSIPGEISVSFRESGMPIVVRGV